MTLEDVEGTAKEGGDEAIAGAGVLERGSRFGLSKAARSGSSASSSKLSCPTCAAGPSWFGLAGALSDASSTSHGSSQLARFPFIAFITSFLRSEVDRSKSDVSRDSGVWGMLCRDTGELSSSGRRKGGAPGAVWRAVSSLKDTSPSISSRELSEIAGRCFDNPDISDSSMVDSS